MTKSFLGKNYRAVLSELVLFSPDDEKVYELTIKEKKKKRSLDANAYCWVLLKQLSKKLRIPPIELYKEFIHRGNAYTVVTLKTEAAAKYGEIWANNGIGWICEEIGERNGYTSLKCYHGSSSYTTEEMSRLIDEVVFECKHLGIEPDDHFVDVRKMVENGSELAILKENWK